MHHLRIVLLISTQYLNFWAGFGHGALIFCLFLDWSILFFRKVAMGRHPPAPHTWPVHQQFSSIEQRLRYLGQLYLKKFPISNLSINTDNLKCSAIIDQPPGITGQTRRDTAWASVQTIASSLLGCANTAQQWQRYPCAVWTTELRLEQVATAGAGSDSELWPQAASRKASYVEPGQKSWSFHGLSWRSGPGAWQLPARPSYWLRWQACRSQGWHSRDCTWLMEQ